MKIPSTEHLANEIEGMAPKLSRLRRTCPNPIPDTYFEKNSAEMLHQMHLALQIRAKLAMTEAFDEQVKASDPGLKQYFMLLPDQIISAMSEEVDNANSASVTPMQPNPVLQLTKQIKPIPRWLATAAACMLGGVFLYMFTLLREPENISESKNLTLDESFGFIEQHIDELDLEILIEEDILHANDLDETMPQSRDIQSDSF
jgi:hypothetical protein